MRRLAAGVAAREQGVLPEIVEKLTPLLRVQARLRLRHAAAVDAADDLIQETWMHFVEKWPDLDFDGEATLPRLVKFLGKVLLLKANDYLRRELRRRAVPISPTPESGFSGVDAMLMSSVTDAMVRAMRGEVAAGVRDAFANLTDGDRLVIVLRGIEGLSNEAAALQLGIEAFTAAKRYERALTRLRERLPASLVAAYFGDP